MSGDPALAAVVGANGFLGSATVRALARGGIPTMQFTREHSFLDPTGQSVAEADTIFWLASSIRPATASGDPNAVKADRDAVNSLLDLIDRSPRRGRCRVVVASSGGTVYDPAECPPHDETTPIRAANAYGEAMLVLENLVRARAPQSSILRVANAYGPGQPARRGQGVIAYWMDQIFRDAPITLIGEASVARDYVYVDDVAAALTMVHAAETAPATMNIGSGHGTSLGQLLAAVRAAVAPQIVQVRHQASRSFDAPSTWLDVGVAADTFGWRPRIGLSEGLARTWQALDPSPANVVR